MLPRLQGQRSLRPSFLCTNTGAALLVVFVFLNFLFVGYKLGEVIGDTKTTQQYLAANSKQYLRHSP